MEQRERLSSVLPGFAQFVRGSLVTRYRRCGKPICHCAKSRGHGPAHYLVVTLGPGKTEQILRAGEMLPVARQFRDNDRRWWAAAEKVSAVNRRLLRRRIEGWAQGKASPRGPTQSAGRGGGAEKRRPVRSPVAAGGGWG